MSGTTVKLGATSLMYACQQGKESQVYEIIRSKPGAAVERERSLKTALHYCAESGEGGVESAAALLAAAPELVAATDQDGYTALHLAVIAGNSRLAGLLIARNADLNAADNEGHTAAHWATVCGELECLELILEKGGDPNVGDMHGGCPLHYAAQMCGPGSEMPADRRLGMAALRLLIDHSANPNIPDHHGRQPILWASSAGSSEAILVLTNSGANVEAADNDGLTALHCAASRGHTDCVETLVSLCNAEPDVIDNNGCSALFYAVTLGHADCTQALLNHGANTNRQDRKGRTAMHCGAAKGQMETLKVVWSRGGNLWTRTARGDYPLHEAVSSGRGDLVSWLLSLRPDTVNSPNNDGRCPLHLAAIQNNVEMSKVLLDAGSLVNPVMRTAKGSLATPLDAALHKGHRGTAKYLQLHGGVPASRLNSESAALRGPNSRNSVIQSQNPLEYEKDIAQEMNVQNKSPRVQQRNTDQQNVQLPQPRQKMLQVYVEDGVMIKRIKHPQALDDTRIRRRRRKRKTRQSADKTSRIDKDKGRRDNYGGTTDEEGNTSQASSFLDSRMVTDSESEGRRRAVRDGVKKVQKPLIESSQVSQHREQDQDEENSDFFQIKENDIVKRNIQEVQVEHHRSQDDLDDDVKNVESFQDSVSFNDIESSRETVSLNTTKLRKSVNEDSTQSDVTVVEQTSGIRKKRSTDESRDASAIDENTAVTSERTDSKSESANSLEESGKKDGPSEVSNKLDEEINKSDVSNAINEESTANIVHDEDVNNHELPTQEAETNQTIEEENNYSDINPLAGEKDTMTQNSTQPELYDSLEDVPPNQEETNNLDLSIDRQQVENFVDETNHTENVNVLTEPNENTDSVDDTNTMKQDGKDENTLAEEGENDPGNINEVDLIENNQKQESEFKENEQEINSNVEKTENYIINYLITEPGSQIETNEISSLNNKQIKNNQDDKINTSASETIYIEEGENQGDNNSEGVVGTMPEVVGTMPEGVVGTMPEGVVGTMPEGVVGTMPENHKTAVYMTDDVSTIGGRFIKVPDEDHQSVLDSEGKSKPKRKEWKRQRSREGWEPHSVSPQNEDVPDQKSHDHSPLPDVEIQPSPQIPRKLGLKGPRPKSKSRIPRMCTKGHGDLDNDIPLSTVSVTQAVQYSVRKYHLERRIFHQLLELKRLQIRAGRSSEGVLVKRLVDDYRRAGLMLGLQQYNGVYTFRAFERYLYDQLRLLQSSERRIIPRLKSSDDLERLTSALKKTRAGQDVLTSIPNNPTLCTYQTHRCHHATHAYTGIPCAAYIRKDHHTMPKPGSFLPKLVGSDKGDLSKSLRFVDPARPLTLELSHGSEKQVITLPTEKLDKSKRYFVTFTVKTGNKKKFEESPGHGHPASV